MITGGVLTKEKVTFRTQSPKAALLLKGGLAGNNTSITISPFGHRVDFNVDGNTLVLRKNPEGSFCYEEIRGIIKRIKVFGKLKDKDAEDLQTSARQLLESHLTFFYPDVLSPTVELTFAYNWVSIGVESAELKGFLFPAIREAVRRYMGESVKVFSNFTDIVSIHNYKMNGLYINRRTFQAITDILAEKELIKPKDKAKFLIQATAFSVKSVSFMEARRLCQTADETFEMGDDFNDNPLLGNKDFLKSMLEMLSALSKNGDFDDLSDEHLKLMYGLKSTPEIIAAFTKSETITSLIEALIQNFSQEIDEACRNHGIVSSTMQEIESLLKNVALPKPGAKA